MKMIDWTGIAAITVALAIWWYAPIYLSRRNAAAAERETDWKKKLNMLDWAVFFHRTPKAVLQFADALFRAAQVDDNLNIRLVQTQQSRRIVEGILLADPPEDVTHGARALLDEIKSYEPTAKKLADAAAENARRKMRAL